MTRRPDAASRSRRRGSRRCGLGTVGPAAARSPTRIAETTAAVRAVARVPWGVRRRGDRARNTSGRATRTVPSTASTTGARPSSRMRGSSVPSGTSEITTVGRDPPQPQRVGTGGVQQLGQGGLVVAAQERLGVPGTQRAEPSGDVVDEVGQRLGDRGARGGGDEVVHLGRRPAGVERAPDRRGGEAVDGRPAARLHVGHQRQLAGELLLERSRGDGGQVGLEQHVVDGARQQVVECLARGPRPRRAAGRRR